MLFWLKGQKTTQDTAKYRFSEISGQQASTYNIIIY